MDDSKSRGIFDGNCRIVPSLSAPGFCNAEAKSGFLAGMPDVSSYYNGGGLTYTYASTGELKSFKAAFGTKLQHDFGSFKADFEVISDGKVRDVFIPFSSFSNKWSASTGEPTTACSSAHPEVCPTAKSLSEIGAVGIWAEGVAGQFHVELLKISATNGTTVAAAPTKNIVELAQSVPTLSTLVTAVVAANLTGVLSSPGPFTVFAPNNDAFAKVPADILKHLLEPRNIAELQEVLELHVVAGAVYAADLKDHEKIKTVNGLELEARLEDSKVFIEVAREHSGTHGDYAEVIAADNVASNGVVHIIDHVLYPLRGQQRRLRGSA